VYFLDCLMGSTRAAAFVCVGACFGFYQSASAEGLQRIQIGATAPPFSAKGADGRQHRLSDYGGKLVVLEWTSPVCPFTAVKYKNGAMQDLQGFAAAHSIIWLSIDTAAPNRAGFLSAPAARARVRQTHSKVSAFLFDPDGHIARGYGAKTTPSFFIVDRSGRLAYQGAMDEQVFADDHVGHEYVKSALDDLIAGRPVQNVETQPQGCAIEY
jgi:hypothetical protein